VPKKTKTFTIVPIRTKLKFDAYIEEQHKALGLVTEEYQDSNVIADFFKKVKYAAKGGKPAEPPSITLKDPKNVDKLKRLLNPRYDVAIKDPNVKDPLKGNVVNPAFVSVSLVNFFQSAAMTTRSQMTTDILNILSKTPHLPTNSKNPSIRTTGVNDVLAKVNLADIVKTVRGVVDPAVKAGVLKWEEPREYSPKDLMNKLTDKIAAGVKQTAGEVWNQDTIARM
jgi:hypothetical protein